VINLLSTTAAVEQNSNNSQKQAAVVVVNEGNDIKGGLTFVLIPRPIFHILKYNNLE